MDCRTGHEHSGSDHHFSQSDFKDRIANGESLDSILPEAFATVREASSQVYHLPHKTNHQTAYDLAMLHYRTHQEFRLFHYQNYK